MTGEEAGVGEREELGEVRETGGNWTGGEVGVVREEGEAEGMQGHHREVSEAPGEQAAREAWEAGWPGGKQGVRRGFFGSGWIVGITLLLLIIAGVVMFMITGHQGLWDKTVAAMAADSGNAKRETRDRFGKDGRRQWWNGSTAGSGVATPASAGGCCCRKGGGLGTMGDGLFANLYKPYGRGDDPKELNQYYEDYRTGNYRRGVGEG